MAFLANPAAFPGIVKILPLTAEVIHKIDGDAVASDQAGDDIALAHQYGGGGVALGKFSLRSRPGISQVRGEHQMGRGAV